MKTKKTAYKLIGTYEKPLSNGKLEVYKDGDIIELDENEVKSPLFVNKLTRVNVIAAPVIKKESDEIISKAKEEAREIVLKAKEESKDIFAGVLIKVQSMCDLVEDKVKKITPPLNDKTKDVILSALNDIEKAFTTSQKEIDSTETK